MIKFEISQNMESIYPKDSKKLVSCLCCVGVGGVEGAVIVGVEELQPISVAGNPVGNCYR